MFGLDLNLDPSGKFFRTPIAQLVQRYFWDFTAAASQYGEFSSDIVLDGDFEIEFDTQVTGTTTSLALSGADSGNRFYIGAENGELLVGNGSDRFTSTGSNLNDGKLHKVVWKNTLGVTTVTIDGVGYYSAATQAIFPKSIPNFGSGVSGFPWDGILANIKIWKDGDRNTGILIADFPLDSDLISPVIPNKAAVLGSDVVVNGSFDSGSNWNLVPNWTISGGVANYSGGDTPGQREMVQSGILQLGKTYSISGDLLNHASGDFYLFDGSSGVFISNTNGRFEVIFTASTTDLILLNLGSSSQYSVDNIVVKEIPSTTPYLTMQNMTTDDAELFDQVSDGWTGVELWTFGDAVGFTEPSTFTDIIGSSSAGLSPGVYRCNSTVNLDNTVNLRVGGGILPITTQADLPADVTSSISSGLLKFATRSAEDVPVSGDIQNTTVKKFLEVV